MTATPLSNSAAAVPRPERTTTPSPIPRRRGLSSLRRLGPPSPGETSRLSPRSYFTRSTSYPQASPTSHRPNPTLSDAPQGQRTVDSAHPEITSRDTAGHSTQNTTKPNTSPLAHQAGTDATDMARHRPASNLRAASSESIQNAETQRSPRVSGTTSDDVGTVTNAQANGVIPDTSDEKSRPPTIRFFPHQEIRQGRPSLNFAPVIRTLPNESSIIRVGRYSEREGIPVSNPTGPSDAPVGFKSKVVSRKHCEFSFSNGSWQIKDVSSSSGTFLNHIRLSQPNTESRLYPVKDGDIVQLGIDFRGGEEMIFRCVKIRIECNRAWQKRPNNFKYVCPQTTLLLD
jgi:E3 ubiquitin-protein ligase DMA1/2